MLQDDDRRYVGEDGIKPDTAYRLSDNHEFEEVQP